MGAKVFGVSFDSVEKNHAFSQKNDFPFPLLSDTERVMGLAFGTCVDASDGFSARFTFVVGPDGVIEQAIETKDPGAQAEQLVCSLRDHQ